MSEIRKFIQKIGETDYVVYNDIDSIVIKFPSMKGMCKYSITVISKYRGVSDDNRLSIDRMDDDEDNANNIIWSCDIPITEDEVNFLENLIRNQYKKQQETFINDLENFSNEL